MSNDQPIATPGVFLFFPQNLIFSFLRKRPDGAGHGVGFLDLDVSAENLFLGGALTPQKAVAETFF